MEPTVVRPVDVGSEGKFPEVMTQWSRDGGKRCETQSLKKTESKLGDKVHGGDDFRKL